MQLVLCCYVLVLRHACACASSSILDFPTVAVKQTQGNDVKWNYFIEQQTERFPPPPPPYSTTEKYAYAG